MTFNLSPELVSWIGFHEFFFFPVFILWFDFQFRSSLICDFENDWFSTILVVLFNLSLSKYWEWFFLQIYLLRIGKLIGFQQFSFLVYIPRFDLFGEWLISNNCCLYSSIYLFQSIENDSFFKFISFELVSWSIFNNFFSCLYFSIWLFGLRMIDFQQSLFVFFNLSLSKYWEWFLLWIYLLWIILENDWFSTLLVCIFQFISFEVLRMTLSLNLSPSN